MTELDDDTEAFPAPDDGEDQFAKMRAAANRAPKLEKKLTAAEQELAQLRERVAFTEAGLTLSDKQRAALLAAHDGELGRDALRATAAELGFIQADEADGEAAARQAALAAQERISNATNGATPPAAPVKLDEQIAQAMQAGDARLVARLKAQAALQALRRGQPVSVE